MDKIGERIRKLRETRDMSQEALGAACGYEQSTISKIETGGKVGVRAARPIARALGCTFEELVYGTDLEHQAYPEPEAGWDEAIHRLQELHPDSAFEITRCLWCTDTTPAYAGARFTTLCSWECAADLKRVYANVGWPISPDVMVTPLFLRDGIDGDHLYLNPDPPDLILHQHLPDDRLIEIYHRRRHQQGPLRDRLLVERPELKAVLRGGVPQRRKPASVSHPAPTSPEEVGDNS